MRHVSPILSAADLAKVARRANPASTLSDVATVVEDHQPLIGDASVNGQPGLLLIVAKLPGANTVEVTDGVEAALAGLEPAHASDVTVDTQPVPSGGLRRGGADNLAVGLLVGPGPADPALALPFFRWRSALSRS